MRAHRSNFKAGTIGAASPNINVLGCSILRRGGGDNDKAAAVGARGVSEGVAVFTFKIERTRHNDGLGIFIGIADASVDFQNMNEWGKCYALGCHGQNLFSWENGLGVASLKRGALLGSENSVEDGSVVRVRVDMENRELAFSVNSMEYQIAQGIELPKFVRPFCKLAGFTGDKVSLAYKGDETELVTNGQPLPTFKYDVPQNSAMLAYGVHFRPRILGPHGANIISSGATSVRNGGTDNSAALVGARGTSSGTSTFMFRIDHTKDNDGLGVFVGVADSSTDFLNRERWGAAWALGCHGSNLFSWEDGLGSAQLERDAFPGSDESLKDGAVISVRVNMDARPRELAFSVDGSDYVVVKGINLPPTVRPFAKLSGSDGDALSLAYAADKLPPRTGLTTGDEQTSVLSAKDEDIIATITTGNLKLPRESGDSVLVAEVK